MPQKSRRVGNAVVTVKLDENSRAWFRRRHLAEGTTVEVTLDRINAEIGELISYLKARERSQAENEVDLKMASELQLAYQSLLSCFDKEPRQRVVNLELFLLKRLIATAPGGIADAILCRLEDHYVHWGRQGFIDDDGNENDKLAEIGRNLKRRNIYVPWEKYPIMGSIIAPDQMLDSRIDDAANDFHSWLRKHLTEPSHD
jgi:hypothetical protein